MIQNFISNCTSFILNCTSFLKNSLINIIKLLVLLFKQIKNYYLFLKKYNFIQIFANLLWLINIFNLNWDWIKSIFSLENFKLSMFNNLNVNSLPNINKEFYNYLTKVELSEQEILLINKININKSKSFQELSNSNALIETVANIFHLRINELLNIYAEKLYLDIIKNLNQNLSNNEDLRIQAQSNLNNFFNSIIDNKNKKHYIQSITKLCINKINISESINITSNLDSNNISKINTELSKNQYLKYYLNLNKRNLNIIIERFKTINLFEESTFFKDFFISKNKNINASYTTFLLLNGYKCEIRDLDSDEKLDIISKFNDFLDNHKYNKNSFESTFSIYCNVRIINLISENALFNYFKILEKFDSLNTQNLSWDEKLKIEKEIQNYISEYENFYNILNNEVEIVYSILFEQFKKFIDIINSDKNKINANLNNYYFKNFVNFYSVLSDSKNKEFFKENLNILLDLETKKYDKNFIDNLIFNNRKLLFERLECNNYSNEFKLKIIEMNSNNNLEINCNLNNLEINSNNNSKDIVLFNNNLLNSNIHNKEITKFENLLLFLKTKFLSLIINKKFWIFIHILSVLRLVYFLLKYPLLVLLLSQSYIIIDFIKVTNKKSKNRFL